MITEEVKANYKLTETSCGWYISKQGLILTEDRDIITYLLKVSKLNEIDERNEKIKEECLQIMNMVKNEKINRSNY